MALTPEIDHIQASASSTASVSNGSSGHLTPDKLNGEPSAFTFQEKWGLPIEDVYRLGLKFYKEKEGKAPLHIPYTEKQKMVAFARQAAHGPFKTALAPEVGSLDFVGKDRRHAWQSLGEMSKEDAMLRFVDLLDLLCPLFKPYIEAHKRDKEDRERKERDDEDDRRRRDEEERMSLSSSTCSHFQLSSEQEQQIRDALNLQTLQQFKAFCEQQLPGKVEEQKILIAKLQEEHFQQYMKHWMEFQAANNNSDAVLKNGPLHQVVDEREPNKEEDASEGDAEDGDAVAQGSGVGGPVQPASVWTRKDLKEFKDSVKNEGGEGILKIGQGETVTIRVPTHPEGNYLFWEFATDGYDLGFGLFFEWSNNTNDNRVTIHVSETDEDDEDFEGEGPANGTNDPEKGGSAANANSGPPVDEILPVYRRDCHEEVIAGSHLYPARQGVYLLKFDNSFSLWRSKTLYYRVYYTR